MKEHNCKLPWKSVIIGLVARCSVKSGPKRAQKQCPKLWRRGPYGWTRINADGTRWTRDQ